MKDLRSFAPTFARLMGIDAPALAKSESFSELLGLASVAKKALIYCPDAFGVHALERFPELEGRLMKGATAQVELLSVTPPVTPVCFASLFTGAAPSEHGIRHYAKPVLKCDTIFDALVRAGKKTAIVAVKDSSVDVIFRERPIDYFPMDYDPLVTAQVLDLLKANQHDVIVAYHQEYDDLLHATEPFSELAQIALERHVQTWELLLRACKAAWQKDYFVAFTPDHGGHLDAKSGRGDHGLDIPEDMRLKHFFQFA